MAITACPEGAKKKAPRLRAKAPVFFLCKALDGLYVFRRRTLLALRDVKAYALTFLKGFKTGTLDGAVMNKYIPAVIFLDEAEAFLLIKPFHFSFWHFLNPPFRKVGLHL